MFLLVRHGSKHMGTPYMPIYDHPPLEGTSSGPSTLQSNLDSSSNGTQFSPKSGGTSSPSFNVYENVDDFMQICQNSTRRTASEERERPPLIPAHRSNTESAISHHSRASKQLSIDFIKNIPPPPITLEYEKSMESEYGTAPRSLHSCGSVGRRPIDMRPLSIPAHEIKRAEKDDGTRTLVIGLSIATIFVFGFALAIYIFFSEIEAFFKRLGSE